MPPASLLENENNDELNDWPRSGDSDIPPVTHARDLRSAPLRSLHKFHMLVYVCWIVYEYIYYFKNLKSVFEITHKSVNKWLKLNFEKK